MASCAVLSCLLPRDLNDSRSVSQATSLALIDCIARTTGGDLGMVRLQIFQRG